VSDASAIDLFAGSGWGVAARELGIEEVGVELDHSACETRRAAGLATIEADVAAFTRAEMRSIEVDRPLALIASPPCPTFSRNGNGTGVADMPHLFAAADDVAERRPITHEWLDPRTPLVLEPLRWALTLRPRFLAWEQVEPVLPFWRHCAQILRRRGWDVWAGLLSAERYGVPQTRVRAILMADREAEVTPPPATYARYVKPRSAPEHPQLFEAALETDRIVLPEDRDLLPWISMAEALEIHGHGLTLRTGRNSMSSSRDPEDMVPYERPVDAPAPTIDGKSSRWQIRPKDEHVDPPMSWKLRQGNRTKATERDECEPAPTLHFGHAANSVKWSYDRRLQGDPRVSAPGWHDPNESGSQQKDAIRVSVEQAAILQGFPADFPFRGTKSARYLQIGNAVPPPLARAILGHLLAPVLDRPEEAVA
jgi:DNA (cytosine-5)-methyltransferase 1